MTERSKKTRSSKKQTRNTTSRRRKGPRALTAKGQTSATSRSADPIVVYIHGIGRHEPELKVAWDLALFGSDQGKVTRMAYWSDIVHPPVPANPSKKAKGAGGNQTGDLATDALTESGVQTTPAAKEYADTMAAQLGAPTERRRGPGKKVTFLPGFARRPLAEAFLKAFIGDTAAYFFDKAKREAIRKRFSAVLPTDGTPVVVVAHSQGSVIALEVLSALGNQANVVKLVTLGSPLGMQEVQDFLDVPPKSMPFLSPSGIEQWENFADLFDPVALDKRLRGEFLRAAPGSEVPSEEFIRDELIQNVAVRLTSFKPHSAIGYLAHPKVRDAVSKGARRDTMARFVVARDVAASLAVDQRQSLLIEVLEPGYHALGEGTDERNAREAKERVNSEGLTLASRISKAAGDIRRIVTTTATSSGQDPVAAIDAARIDELQRFVAARLTPAEVQQVAVLHRHLNVYAVWRSASKRKLIRRSRAVVQVDAALKSYGASGKDIVWAVLDTGVRSDHPHFAKHGNIAAVWNCTRPGPPTRVAVDDDKDGHGSHVSGIVAGEGEGGLMGMAPEAKLVVYKVLNDRGEGEDAWIIKALDHIATQNANAAGQVIHGINLSLGGPYDSTVYGCGHTPICQELRRQWRSGVLVVVASGNEGQLNVQTTDGEVEINTPMSIGDPANLEDCIAVGSVSADAPNLYGVSPFSSRGPTSDGRVKPDVVAPGERIVSVNARQTAGARTYREDSGTSMAAPHVSGLLAAFLSARREFRGHPDEVKKILLESCTDIGRDRYHQGRGVPNLMKMLFNA